MDRLSALKELALRFVSVADEVAARLPAHRDYLAEQLRRAALSVYLNLREGMGEFSPREKARFYRMSYRSLCESSGCLDVALALHPETKREVTPASLLAANLGPQIHRLALHQRTRFPQRA